MLRSRIAAIGLSFMVLVGLGACSSDKKDDVKAQAKEVTSTTAGEKSSDASGTAGDKSSDVADAIKGAAGVTDECIQAATAWTQVMMQQGQFLTGKVSDEDLKQFQAEFDALDAKVPAELKGDFDVMSTAYGEWAKALGELNLSDPSAMSNPDNVAKLEAASAKLETPEVKQAQDHIDAYFENCGK